MTLTEAAAFNVEDGLMELPGTPARWIWAFTCPTPECTCSEAIILSAPGDRENLLDLGRPVADAWRSVGHYGQVAQDLQNALAFSIDLDTLTLGAPAGDRPLDAAVQSEVRAVADRLDDLLDPIARIWHRGKGGQPPPEPGADGAKIEIEGWRPGDPVARDEARSSLRNDTFVFGTRMFDVVELYCVEPDCDCGDVFVNFGALTPRGAPHPGHVEFDGKQATLHPDHERQRARLSELWAAYCERYPDYQERFARRSATMHGFAGRIVAAPPKPKVGRNELCSCGSGKKFKKCCGAVA